jgi:hypothetical protein
MHDAVVNLVDELGEAGTWSLLLEGAGMVHGPEGVTSLVLIGRCLSGALGYYLDYGRVRWAEHPRWRFSWSGEHDASSAFEQMTIFVQNGLLLDVC